MAGTSPEVNELVAFEAWVKAVPNQAVEAVLYLIQAICNASKYSSPSTGEEGGVLKILIRPIIFVACVSAIYFNYTVVVVLEEVLVVVVVVLVLVDVVVLIEVEVDVVVVLVEIEVVVDVEVD